ncbi:MAG: amino acid adenylation domain-containing protein [Ignavibacteriales bacterium]|nr:amino acid adenylation domain-containing protein [Ignavibacteriales bacterium]
MDKQNITLKINQTKPDYPSRQDIVALFEEQVSQRPAHTAVSTADKNTTYMELNNNANVLAHRLLGLGVKPEARVGIYLDRSVEMIISILAIIKIGGTYVPLDTAYPAERIAYMLKDAEISTVIMLTANTLPETGMAISTILLSEMEFSAALTADISVQRSPESPAYIMYTSGSTGAPKGVVIVDRGIIRLVKNTNYIAIKHTDTIAHLSNTSFDAATFEIWGSLLNGSKLVIIDNPTRISPKLFTEALQKYRISIVFLNTALFNLFSFHNPAMFKELTYVLFGGEIAAASAVERVIKNDPPRNLINVYGPTENTTFSTFYPIDDKYPVGSVVPIGKSISNSEAYILNDAMQIAEPGEIGEIFLAGDGLARGYIGSPELTQQKFVSVPFAAGADKLLYRTGDLGVYLPDGNIVFKGRNDDQVKIHGFRIELQEIRFMLEQIPQIRESLVISKEDDQRGKYICIYYIVQPAVDFSPDEVRDILRGRLPYYMVQFPIIQVQSFPLTPNGKIDVQKLPEQQANTADSYITKPDNIPDEEQQLKNIWIEFFKSSLIHSSDNFFTLGGDSLSAVHMMYRINEAFNIELPIRTIFDSPTIESLVGKIMAALPQTSEGEVVKKTTIITINETGNTCPVFFIPPFVNYSYHFTELAGYLGVNRPSYTFEPNDERLNSDNVTIEIIASTYLGLVRQVQSTGPYILCGWSMGAVIAFEMIRQLNQLGEDNSKLLLIDPSPLTKYYAHKTVPLLCFPLVFLSRVFARPKYITDAKLFLLRFFLSIGARVRKLSSKVFALGNTTGAQAAPTVVEGFLSAKDEITYNRWKPFLDAYTKYRPEKIHCEVVCFWAKDHYHSKIEFFLIKFFAKYWKYIQGKVRHKLTGGAHGSILQSPHSEPLAKAIRLFID